MKPNIELMKRLRTRFLRMRHPEHFKMDVIAAKTDCGSAMCIAGHTLELAGYKKKLRAHRQDGLGIQDFNFFAPSGRKVRNVLSAAGRELGLSYRADSNNEAYRLFHDWELTTPKDAAERVGELIARHS